MFIRSLLLILLLVTAGCVKHEQVVVLQAMDSFSGRLLVMNQAHRFQVAVDWQGDAQQGALRLTHATTGRIIDVSWLLETMMWRDNQTVLLWRALPTVQMLDMGMLLPPWALARIFSGDYPKSMVQRGELTWQGVWSEGVRLKIRWSQGLDRLEITDMRQGKRLVVLFESVQYGS